MSSPAKRQRVPASDGTTTVEPPPPPPAIPVDLLLEVFARLDVATIVRCAATSKTVRRAILDGAAFFGRRVEDKGALLLGVSYAFLYTLQSGQVPRRLRFDAGVLVSAEPVASRCGLVVLRDQWDNRLRVCNVLTGRTCWLPYADVSASYPHALLAVDHAAAGRYSFRLLVVDVDVHLRTQTFSSKNATWRWGPVVQATSLSPRFPRSAPDRGSHAVVLGGTAVHWLHGGDRRIIRLDTDKAQATLIELPPESRVRSLYYEHSSLLLAASTAGELSLVVAEVCVISMWTLSAAAEEGGSSPAARWSRQVVIKREAIGREGLTCGYSAQLLGFGELSGTVILLMDKRGSRAWISRWVQGGS